MERKGWYDEQWNPITGTPPLMLTIDKRIKTYCSRFSGDIRYNLSRTEQYSEPFPGFYELDAPVPSYNSDKNFICAPYGTYPTLHKYRFDTPSKKYKTGRTLYVNPYADTFLLLDEWIDEVFRIAHDNPQHRFVFISKDLSKMKEAIKARPELVGDNMWFGFRFDENNINMLNCLDALPDKGHYFTNFDELTEKMLRDFDYYVFKNTKYFSQIEWILVSGIKNMTVTKLKWFNYDIKKYLGIQTYFDADARDLPHQLPKEFEEHKVPDKKKALFWAKCNGCGEELPKKEMFKIASCKNLREGYAVIGFLCEECYEKFKEKFE